MLVRQRANAPAGEEVRRHEPIGHSLRMLGRHESRSQRVSGVGADGAHLLLVGIQGHGVEALVRHPVCRMPGVAQPTRALQVLLRRRVILERHAGLGHAHQRDSGRPAPPRWRSGSAPGCHPDSGWPRGSPSQAWFLIPTGERCRYSRKPSPSRSPYRHAHSRARSALPRCRRSTSRSPVQCHSSVIASGNMAAVVWVP